MLRDSHKAKSWMYLLLWVFSLFLVSTTDAAADHHTEAAHASAAEHAEDAHGASGHSEAVNWTEFAGSAVNFVALVLLLGWIMRRPLRSFLSNRRSAVESELEEAARMKAEAEAKFKEYSDRLAQMDDELARLRNEMVRAGEAERDRILAEAEAKASRLRRETEFLVEQELKQLRLDLRREMTDAAIRAAAEVLKKNVSSDDQVRLAKEYLKVLSPKPATGNGSRPTGDPSSRHRSHPTPEERP